jgi:uncharacterized protein (DUF1778 family)
MNAYWFEPADGVLGYGDGRKPEVGVTHTVEGSPVLCVRGLHASVQPFDALQHAHSNVLWLVRGGGDIVDGGDKCAATERTYIKRVDVTDVLRRFACDCALDVIEKARPYFFTDDGWETCTDYLRNPTEEKRAAASYAARDAASDAASDDYRAKINAMIEAAFAEAV